MKHLLITCGMLLGTLTISFVHADDKSVLPIQIRHAYVNSVPPVAKVTAGYFEMTNIGDTTIILTAISSSTAEKIELHRSVIVNGRMTMHKLMSLKIAPGEKIKLEPGGMHLMLWGLDRSLRSGSLVPLTLHFSSGLSTTIQAKLRNMRDRNTHHH